MDDIMQALQHVQDTKGVIDVPFWVGETNWPTGGKNFKSAVPSTETAAAYWKDAICGMLGWGVNTFVFEAFDEVSTHSLRCVVDRQLLTLCLALEASREE